MQAAASFYSITHHTAARAPGAAAKSAKCSSAFREHPKHADILVVAASWRRPVQTLALCNAPFQQCRYGPGSDCHIAVQGITIVLMQICIIY